MQDLSSHNQVLFGPWSPHPLLKPLSNGQDLKRQQFRELTCRTLQMGIYAATTLNPKAAFAKTLFYRMVVVLPYASYLGSLLKKQNAASKSHKMALGVMIIHSVALTYMGMPLIGLGGLFAFLATPIILHRAGRESILSLFDRV